jgi:hypothetical protein
VVVRRVGGEFVEKSPQKQAAELPLSLTSMSWARQRRPGAFEDLCGRFRGKIGLPSRIEEIEAVQTADFCEYLAVTTSRRTLSVVDCVTCEIVKTYEERIAPRFVAYCGGRVLMVVKEQGDLIVPVEF